MKYTTLMIAAGIMLTIGSANAEPKDHLPVGDKLFPDKSQLFPDKVQLIPTKGKRKSKLFPKKVQLIPNKNQLFPKEK